MRDEFYMTESSVIINYSARYCHSCNDILSSDGFSQFLGSFLKNLAVRDIKIYSWLTNGRTLEEMISETVKLAKQMLVLNTEEISSSFLQGINRLRAKYLLEESYNYWLSKERFAIVNTTSSNILTFSDFIDADSRYNQLISTLYATLKGRLEGRETFVYREHQTGTNGCALIMNYRWKMPPGCNSLKGVSFVKAISMKTPLLLNCPVADEDFEYVRVTQNPVKYQTIKQNRWFCMPLKVSGLLCFCYFHRDYVTSAFVLSNLFELAREEECVSRKPDIMCFCGTDDISNRAEYYFDDDNGIWIGAIAYGEHLRDVRVVEKVLLSMHDSIQMFNDGIPVTGALLDIYCRDNYARSIVIIGKTDSRIYDVAIMMRNYRIAGKEIERADVVFDRRGLLKTGDKVTAYGIEIGNILALKNFNVISKYCSMERSILFNTQSEDAMAIVPINSYDYIMSDRKIDMVYLLDDDISPYVVGRLSEKHIQARVIDTHDVSEKDYAEAVCKQIISALNES